MTTGRGDGGGHLLGVTMSACNQKIGFEQGGLR